MAEFEDSGVARKEKRKGVQGVKEGMKEKNDQRSKMSAPIPQYLVQHRGLTAFNECRWSHRINQGAGYSERIAVRSSFPGQTQPAKLIKRARQSTNQNEISG